MGKVVFFKIQDNENRITIVLLSALYTVQDIPTNTCTGWKNNVIELIQYNAAEIHIFAQSDNDGNRIFLSNASSGIPKMFTLCVRAFKKT